MFGNKSCFNQVVVNGRKFNFCGNNIKIIDDKVYVDGEAICSVPYGDQRVVIYGNVTSVTCGGSVEINGDCGSIDCGGSCTVKGKVNGDIDAGGSVSCGAVLGDIDAGGSVRCKR